MPNKKNLLLYVLFFTVILLGVQYFTRSTTPPPGEVGAFTVRTLKNTYAVGEEVKLELKNNTAAPIKLSSFCPQNPYQVHKWNGTEFVEVKAQTTLPCERITVVAELAPGQKETVSYTYWNNSLFGEPSRYKIQVLEAQTHEFVVEPAGFWRTFFRSIFYQPIYNVLIFLISVMPLKDLGLAIIVLTILIRLVLLVPSQRALVSQKRMQELQPKLEEVRKKYEGNQERIAQETMAMWKQHKVNPFGSCLPLIIQFPVLIALFYVIQNGLNPDNMYLLYEPLKHVDLSNIHTNFLGILDLTKVNPFILPLIVGFLQFFQFKLTMAKKKVPKIGASEMETANKMMMYMMPVMIAVFTASVPAGVGLYWGVSTLFGIGQQLVVNKKV